MSQQTLETDTTTLVNQTLNDFFERSITHATLIDSSYRQLWETLYGLIRSGGKRLRPKMTLLSYEVFGGKDHLAVVPVAAAQELLHFCLLIHDDIIDRDYVRYGTANVAGRYLDLYRPFVKQETERAHYANSAAILGGDLMLSGAYQLIAQSTLPNEDKLIAQELLAHSIFEVAAGELLDTESSFVPYTVGDALSIAKYKTASYSFISPLLTGARLAGANQQQLKIMSSYGQALGVAYQLVDDILGVFGVEEETGKSASGDIREGKRTYMIEQALEAMTKEERIIFDRTFAQADATSDDIDTVRELLISTGARQKNEEAIARYSDEARQALGLLELDAEQYDIFDKLIHKVTERSF